MQTTASVSASIYHGGSGAIAAGGLHRQASHGPCCAARPNPFPGRVASLARKGMGALSREIRVLGVGRRRRGGLEVRAGVEYDKLRGEVVTDAETGELVAVDSIWDAIPGQRCLFAFLTHFADLSSWEYAQFLKRKVLPVAESKGVRVIAVGLGSLENAQKFAKELDFPISNLFACPDGALYTSLGFSPGFGEDLDISPYAKLFPMLLGVGSPGTMQEVLRGYVGDSTRKAVFDASTPFDILGKGYQRPFELATVRLLNMGGILPKWGELCPPKTSLLTQQGGTFIFEGEEIIFKHVDSGILKYANVDEILKVLDGAPFPGGEKGLAS